MTTNIATKSVKRTQPPLDITRPFMDDIGEADAAVSACVRAQRQSSARWRRTVMGAALDRFIDEDGYGALDALNELRESYGFGHREGHMHGLRLAPVER